MKILLIDDSEIVLRVLKSHLKKFGYDDVDVMTSAADANIFLASIPDVDQVEIDLIICDIEMPGMDGITFCRNVKSNPILIDIPIIIMTANADEDSLERAFEAGALDYITKPPRKIDLLARIRSAETIKKAMDHRRQMTHHLAEANRRLEEESSVDALTNIFNRRKFDDVLAAEWRRAMRNRHPISLLMLDIDHFKKYNDHFGHPAGDDCLRTVGDLIRRGTRRAGDVAARYGGEEFGIILPNAPLDAAVKVAEGMRLSIEAAGIKHAPETDFPVITATIGIACCLPTKGQDSSLLLGNADQALYKGKRDGRNQVVSAEESV